MSSFLHEENPKAEWLQPLRIREFRLLWATNLISAFGSMIQAVGASWMMVLIGGSPLFIALVQAGIALPMMLFGLLAGAIADSFSRRNIMLAAQSYMLVVSLILVVLAALDKVGPYLLLALTFLIGSGTALNAPAWQALVGDLISRKHLSSAVALNALAINLARSAGPAVGGAILFFAGPVAAFGINAASYLGIILALLVIKIPKKENALPTERLGRAMAGGVLFAFHSPNIRTILFRAIAFGVVSSVIPAMLPLVARDILGGDSTLYGILLGAFGAGAVVGAVVGAKFRRTMRTEHVIMLASISMGLASIVIGFSAIDVISGAALFVAGAGWVLTLSTFNVMVQLSAPRWVAARSLSLYQMCMFGGVAVGSLLWGAMAEQFGLPYIFLLAGFLQASGPALRLIAPIMEISGGEIDLSERWREPIIGMDIKADGGPILIEVTYLIDDNDVSAFVLLMIQRRQNRLRNGARQWRLTRDLADLRSWTEQYECSTWSEYVRHNMRSTRADAVLTDQLAAFHCDSLRPLVRRRIEHLRSEK